MNILTHGMIGNFWREKKNYQPNRKSKGKTNQTVTAPVTHIDFKIGTVLHNSARTFHRFTLILRCKMLLIDATMEKTTLIDELYDLN